MHFNLGVEESEVVTLRSAHQADRLDARIPTALLDDPHATVMVIAERTGLSRNTVQERVGKRDEAGALSSFECRVAPAILGPQAR